MPFMNLKAAGELMQKNGVDALVATTPPSFFYTSNYSNILPGVPTVTVTPADATLEPAMILNNLEEKAARETSHIKDIRLYPHRMELVNVKNMLEGKLKKVAKSYQFDIEAIYGLLSDILRNRGLQEGTIAVEMASLTHRVYSALVEQNPKARFVDARGILGELQRVKTKESIEALRIAAMLGTKGIQGMIDGGVLGATPGELELKYTSRIIQEVTNNHIANFKLSRGAAIIAGDFFTSEQLTEYKVSPGDNIFIDCGVVVNGHVSDMGRCFVAGKASPLQQRIFSALKTGYEKALSMMRPGAKLSEIYNATQETIRRSGLDWFTTGHFGHSIGIGPPSEQWPWICADEEGRLEPNMVMCLETTLYVPGLGAFQLEDMILITPEGHEFLTELPRDMLEI